MISSCPPYSGRLIPVQPHLHTLGMPGSFLIAWFDLISFDLRVSTRSQSRLLFWSRFEVLWSRSDCFDNAMCACACAAAWLPLPDRPSAAPYRARSRSSTSEASAGCSPLTSLALLWSIWLSGGQRSRQISESTEDASSLRTLASLHALTLGSGPPLPHQSPRRFGIRQIELSAVTLTSLPTACRKWVMSMSSKSPKTNTYRPTLTPTIGNNTSENSRWSQRFPRKDSPAKMKRRCLGCLWTRLWNPNPRFSSFEQRYEWSAALFEHRKGASDPLRSSPEWRKAYSGEVEHAKPTRCEAIWRGRPSIDRYLSGKYEHKRSRSDWSPQS